MSRSHQALFNTRCLIQGIVTLRWRKVPFFYAGLKRAISGR